jgi:DHA1 family bicyclomycin/chloramphenicol resistance-like MFS transporter
MLHRGGHLLTGTLAFSFAAGFLYIAASSVFLTKHLGVASTGFAWLFVPLVGGYMLGAFLSGLLASQMTPTDSAWWGYRLMSLAVGINVLLSYAVPPSLLWSVTPLFFYAVGQAIAAPR